MTGARPRGVLLPALLLAASCFGGQGVVEDAVTVEVRNDQFLSIVVYAVRDGQEIRLGTVDGNGSGEFGLPRTYTPPLDLRLRADPIGSDRTYLSPSLSLLGGETVELHVAASLPLSNVTIRRGPLL